MDAKQLINNYFIWLKNNTEVVTDKTTGWHMVTTPFTGLFNDLIEIFFKIDGENILLSDDGYTLRNLKEIGIDIDRSKTRKKILSHILTNFGIIRNGDELIKEATIATFPQKKHSFLEALIEINDLFMLTRHNVSTIFKEDVEEYLNSLSLVYTRNFKFTGKSGIDFNFDFLIAHKTKEIVIRAINFLNKTTLTSFLYAWLDIKEVRRQVAKKEIMSVAVINDEKYKPKPEYIDAIRHEQANYILWSKRDSDEAISLLKAA